MNLRNCLVALSACLLVPSAATAKPWAEGWVFSPYAGMSNPALTDVYNHIFNAPFVGSAQIEVDVPQDLDGAQADTPVQDFFFENPLPRASYKPEAGLEFRRVFGSQHDFVIGISVWEIGSKAMTRVVFPIEGKANNDALYERRAAFSYTQFYTGWRYYFGERARRINFYSEVTLNEIFDIDYKENHVFDFITGEPAGFKKIVVYRTQATGLLMAQLAVGSELRITDRFTFGVEGGYYHRLLGGTFRGVTRNSDIDPENDRVLVRPDRHVLAAHPLTDEVYALDPDGQDLTRVRLSLEGWRFMAKFNIAF